MPTRPNEYRAYYTIIGNFTPEEISSFVGLQPSESWIKGDVNPVNGHERRFSRWSVYSRLDRSQPIEDHVDDVLQQLTPVLAKVGEIASKYESVMQVVAYFYREKPWLHFERSVIAACAALRVGIDCDFYNMYSDRREDSETY